MSASVTLGPGAALCHLPPLRLVAGGPAPVGPGPSREGGVLEGGVLGYDRVGRRGAPAVLVLGGISAGCRVGSAGRGGRRGWWEAQVGRGRPLDPARFEILGIDYLGGAGASSAVEAVDTADQAAAIEALLDRLGIDRLHAVVGASYGGQVGQRLAARAPARVGRLVSISAPFAPTPLAVAWRSIQRRIVALATAAGRERDGVALARELAMTTYRSAQDLAARFPRASTDARSALHGWLGARGAAFAEAFDGASWGALSASIDAHEQDPSAIPVPTTVVAVAEDQLVPVDELRADAARLPRGRFVALASPFGHDAFLKEVDAVAAILSEALGEPRAPGERVSLPVAPSGHVTDSLCRTAQPPRPHAQGRHPGCILTPWEVAS